MKAEEDMEEMLKDSSAFILTELEGSLLSDNKIIFTKKGIMGRKPSSIINFGYNEKHDEVCDNDVVLNGTSRSGNNNVFSLEYLEGCLVKRQKKISYNPSEFRGRQQHDFRQVNQPVIR